MKNCVHCGASGRKKYCDVKCEFAFRLVPQPSGCIEWMGTRNKPQAKSHKGYGRITIDGKNRVAHREYWIMIKGPIPKGLHCLHKCNNPACCNLDHLYIGSRAQNMHDKIAAGTQMIGEKHWKTILNDSRVFNIWHMLMQGLTVKFVALFFKVSDGTINGIKYGNTWKHLGLGRVVNY